MVGLMLMLLACGEDDPDPAELCRAEGTNECCSDDECGDDAICHFQYTCITRDGRRECREPVGDRACHELCSEDTATEHVCRSLTQECQTIQHAQGTDYYEEVTACF